MNVDQYVLEKNRGLARSKSEVFRTRENNRQALTAERRTVRSAQRPTAGDLNAVSPDAVSPEIDAVPPALRPKSNTVEYGKLLRNISSEKY